MNFKEAVKKVLKQRKEKTKILKDWVKTQPENQLKREKQEKEIQNILDLLD